MAKIIAACGNDCSVCPRYTAHPFEKTEEELRHTSELWLKIGYRDHVVSNEEISCTGCRPSNSCRFEIIACTSQKGLATCAECIEYPCDKTAQCLAITKSFEPMCQQVCTDKEYDQIRKAFFEKKENLDEIIAMRKRK